jgi:hypothetical protein
MSEKARGSGEGGALGLDFIGPDSLPFDAGRYLLSNFFFAAASSFSFDSSTFG